MPKAGLKTPDRIIAIDWSGARRAAHRKIWLCEVAKGTVRRLERGRAREEVAEHLLDEAKRAPGLVVGLDFAFSFPAAFLEKRGHRSMAAVWEEAAAFGEEWLASCPFPFWGKKGSNKPAPGTPLLRRTEAVVGETVRPGPKSVFQIAGAGAVGVGSIRGMPVLRELRAGGFAVWPFDAPRLPLVVEIWPRVFMGKVKKSRSEARADFLKNFCPEVTGKPRTAAVENDDAFDALVTAVAMNRHRRDFARLERASDRTALLEGEIWRPDQHRVVG